MSVLVVNPSLSHEREIIFWADFVKSCSQNFVAVDAISGVKFRQNVMFDDYLCIPRKPHKIYRDNRESLSFDRLLDKPEWFVDDLEADLLNFASQVFLADKILRDDIYGLRILSWYIDEVVSSRKYTKLLIGNKVEPLSRLFYTASKHYSVDFFLFERSPLFSFWIEKEGFFAESGIGSHEWSWRSENTEKPIETLKENLLQFRADEYSHYNGRNKLEHANAPYALLLLDNLMWTGWGNPYSLQGRIDYSNLESPAKTIKQISESLEKEGIQLRVRKHPSCQYFAGVADDLGATWSTGELSKEIAQSEFVVVGVTKLAWNTLALGKTTVGLVETPLTKNGFIPILTPNEIGVGWKKISDKQIFLSNEFEHWLENTANKYFVQDGSDMLGLVDNKKSADAVRPNLPLQKLFAKSLFSNGKQKSKDWLITEATRYFSGASKNGIYRVQQQFMKNSQANIIPLSKKSSLNLAETLSWISERGTPIVGMDVLKPGLRLYFTKELPMYFSMHLPLPEITVELGMKRAIIIHDVINYHSWIRQKAELARTIVNSTSDEDLKIFVSAASAMRFRLLRSFGSAAAIQHLSGVAEHVIPANERSTKSRYDLSVSMLIQSDPRKNSRLTLRAARNLRKLALREGLLFSASVLIDSETTYRKFSFETRSWMKVLIGLSDQDMIRELSSNKYFLYLSKQEGFGMPALEAAQLGSKPVLQPLSSLPEILGDSALYVRNPSPSKVAQTIFNNHLTTSESLTSSVELKKDSWKSWAEVAGEIENLLFEFKEKDETGSFWRINVQNLGSTHQAGDD